MSPTPLLIISDAPTAGTGLSRITRDLATRIHAHLPEFRVGTLGYGGPYSRALGFPQYSMTMNNWVIYNLPEVWEDFSGSEKGIILVIWDPSRTLWLNRPENCTDPRLREFLSKANLDVWGYIPIDATGPHDRLTALLKHTVEGYDRLLAYSKWSEAIFRRTLWKKPLLASLTNIPHGIDATVFRPRDKTEARATFGEKLALKTQADKWVAIPDKHLLVGIVATNQARKDFGLGIATIAEIARTRDVTLWIKTDELERHWHIPGLLNDFGILKNVIISTHEHTDEQMSWAYSASDVTLGIGNAEGFGYPIFESLACGTPCIHGDYGGAAEHLPDNMKIPAVIYKLEGIYNTYRGVHDPVIWAAAAQQDFGKVSLPEHLDWTNLWPRWEKWFKDGL